MIFKIILFLFTVFIFETNLTTAFHYPERVVFFKPSSIVHHDSNYTLEAKKTFVNKNEVAEYDYEYEDEGIKFDKSDNYTIYHHKKSSTSSFNTQKLNRIFSFIFLTIFIFAFLCLCGHCLFQNRSSRVDNSSAAVINRDGNLIVCRHNRIGTGSQGGVLSTNLIEANQRIENAYGATYPLAPRQNLVISGDNLNENSFKIEMPPPYEEVESLQNRRRLEEAQLDLPQHPPPYEEGEELKVES